MPIPLLLKILFFLFLYPSLLAAVHARQDKSSVQSAVRVVRNLDAVSLKKWDGVIVYDYGRHMAGKKAKLSAEVVNKLGADLKLQLFPSCGCTELSVSELGLNRDDSAKLEFSITPPSNTQVFHSTIKCVDQTANVAFQIGIVMDSVGPIQISPTSIDLESTDNLKSLSFSLRPAFKGVEILEVISQNPFTKIASINTADDGFDIVVDVESKSFSPSLMQDDMHFWLKFKEQAQDTELALRVPTFFKDRMSLGPSTMIFKPAENGFEAQCYVRGRSIAEEFKKAKASLHFATSEVESPLEIKNVRTRGESAVLFTLSLPESSDKRWSTSEVPIKVKMNTLSRQFDVEARFLLIDSPKPDKD